MYKLYKYMLNISIISSLLIHAYTHNALPSLLTPDITPITMTIE